MGLPKKLTEQQMKFANLLISEQGRKTATQCAIEAGYAKDSARQAASKLQNPKLYPLVVQYIGELREEWQQQYEVTFANHILELGKLRDAAREKKAWSAAVNAEVARGKAAGLYIEQKIIRTGFYLNRELNTHVGFNENRAIIWHANTWHSPLNWASDDKSKRYSIICQFKEVN
jgi:hypothetical protein